MAEDLTTYVVKAGDTLSEIAQKFKSQFGFSDTYDFVDKLAELNNLTDPNYIVTGQTIKLSGEADPVKANTTARPTIKVFGLQSNTDRTVYATWNWDKDHTEEYKCMWYYDTGDSVWFVGSDSSVKVKQCTYNAPNNAKRVKFKVKAVSKTYTSNKKETTYWTGGWSTEMEYNFSNNPPTKPSVPNVTTKDYTLTATLDNLDVNGTEIEFQVVKDDTTLFKTGKATIKLAHAAYSCDISAGSEYKVRCRAVRGSLHSDWTDYSSNVGTIPSVPTGIVKLKTLSETSVYVDWEGSKNADTYDLEYTTQKRYFGSSTEVRSMSIGEGWTHAEVTGLESGQEYFFRVRAVNNAGESGWSEIKSIVVGKKPAAPTTWSSTTTVIVGEPLTLYWVHNSEDGSSQTYADLELYIGGVKETHTIANSTDEEEKDKTSSYVIDTSGYREGTQIQWRVRTSGITKEYGDWSVQRTVDVYAPPTLTLNARDSSGSSLSTLTSFPISISALAGPNTQAPIGYHISIKALDSYETVDSMGNFKMVNAGEDVYAKYFDTSLSLSVTLSAGDVDLENNVQYIISCTVSMNSGLTAESHMTFNVAWTDEMYEPNCEVNIDKTTFTTSIMPYCQDENGELISDISLSVYRREFDGSFVELATGLDNSSNTFITDPHPALDYARYRIVAISNSTGAVSYYDPPGIPVGGNDIIIQWDEAWSSFNTINEDAFEQPEWTGSMLKLPYNIDVSDTYSNDVENVKYIGRKYPVSYYGTQIGMTSTWNTDIDKNDEETLHGLRRLALWMGDVYVREPSGSGYWANVSVSFSQKHLDLTIPVTLNITRVSGGV